MPPKTLLSGGHLTLFLLSLEDSVLLQLSGSGVICLCCLHRNHLEITRKHEWECHCISISNEHFFTNYR